MIIFYNTFCSFWLDTKVTKKSRRRIPRRRSVVATLHSFDGSMSQSDYHWRSGRCEMVRTLFCNRPFPADEFEALEKSAPVQHSVDNASHTRLLNKEGIYNLAI